MWYIIGFLFFLAIIILTGFGKRNIIMLLKVLKIVSLFFVPIFIITAISRVGDKVILIFDIGFTIFILLGLAIGFIVVKRRKFLDELDQERIAGIISISIVSMVGMIIEFIIRLAGNIF